MTLLIGTWPRPAAAAVLAAIGALLASGPARADFATNIYTSGHADIGVGLENDGGGPELFLHYHFANATVNGATVPDAEIDPALVTTVVAEGRRITLGAGESLPFLGVGPGDTVSILPQSNVPGVPFLGLATEELEDADWTTGIAFSLLAFSGPGQMAVWQNSAFGGFSVLFDTIDGIGADDAFTFPIGIHDHANYGFTATGLYDATIRVSGTHVTAGLLSDTATFRFRVEPFQPTAIPEPASLAMMGMGAFGVLGAVAIRRSSRRSGVKEAA